MSFFGLGRVQQRCTRCYALVYGKDHTSGSCLIELLLWVMFIIPGIIYSIWRLTTRRPVCPKCGSPELVPADSPRGSELGGPG